MAQKNQSPDPSTSTLSDPADLSCYNSLGDLSELFDKSVNVSNIVMNDVRFHPEDDTMGTELSKLSMALSQERSC